MGFITPLILCGGKGTRLWPLSRESYPKQFVDLGNHSTLFGETLVRALSLPNTQEPVIVCNEEHRFFVAAELYAHAVHAQILLEPEGRNTAPAIALAALALAEKSQEAVLLVLPSDHKIGDQAAFAAGVEHALTAVNSGYIVTFGITPNAPKTGFGYIQQGEELYAGCFRVARFVEKPAKEVAQAMLQEGHYVWNSGMFMMRATTYLTELQAFAPKIFDACRAAWEEKCVDGAFIRPEETNFLSSPSDSIDYAVMEKTQKAAVLPLSLPWSDLGSWEAFYQAGMRDQDENVSLGDVLCLDTQGCYLNAQDRLVATIGLRDMLVVETKDAVLVAPRTESERVKEIATRLRSEGRPEYKKHPLVYRPWGSYEVLTIGERFQVKRIIVHPGAELSLQMHHHRAEHWIVVSGTAEVTKDEETTLFTENQSTYIPLGTKHRLKNPGIIPLVIIEIQSGAYLGEDDIVRFEDTYGR